MTRRARLPLLTRIAVALACAVVLFATAVLAGPSIEVLPSTDELAIGDRLELLVTVRVDDPTERHQVRFQPWGETLGTAEILAVAPIQELPGPGDSTLFQQRLVLTLFELGEVILPPIEATVIDSGGETPLTSSSTTLMVRSVLPEGAEEIVAKPPAPPRQPTLGRPFWWSATALALTCLVAFSALRRVSGGAESDVGGQPMLAPMEELRRSLVALRSETDTLPLHAQLSQAVRRYLGRSLSFQALESTTTEVRRQLRDRHLPPDVVRQTGDLLSACDMVKFARQDVDLSAAQARIGAAEAIAGSVAAATTAAEVATGDQSGEPA